MFLLLGKVINAAISRQHCLLLYCANCVAQTQLDGRSLLFTYGELASRVDKGTTTAFYSTDV